MPLETWSGRSWVLAAIAGWALLMLVLALAGLGGRIATLPLGPPVPLPALGAAASVAPLEPLDRYAEISSRPLFSTNRQPQPFFLEGQGQEQASNDFDFVLSSVLITRNTRLAIVQPTQGGASVRFRQGEAEPAHPRWRLVDVQPRSATFEGPDGVRTLELRVFDGRGGQPPTRSSPPAPPQGAPGAPPAAASAQPPRPPVAPPAAAPAPAPAVDREAARAAQQASGEQPAPSDEQVEAIRRRIQARREQLRQQTTAPNSP